MRWREGWASISEPTLICLVFVILTLLSRMWFGMEASASGEITGSLNMVKRWAAQLSIVALALFVLRYRRTQDISHAALWLVRTMFLYTLLMMFARAFTTLKSFRNHVTSFFSDGFLVDLDKVLHFGVDPWKVYAPLTDLIPFQYIDHFYSVWWLYAALGMTAVAAGIEQDERLRKAVMRVYLSIWAGLGLGVATITASAGPVYYERVTGDVGRFQAWRDFVEGLGYLDLRANVYTETLWDWYASGHEGIGGGIAAFPSLHVAMAMFVALYAFTFNRLFGALGLVWVTVIQVGSVLLGWHYAVDGYFSILIVAAFWWYFVPENLRRGRFPLFKDAT